MTRWEQTWAAEVLAAFAPATATQGLTPRAGEVDYISTFMRLLKGSTPLAALGLRAALWMVVLAPLWLWGRSATFSRLAAAERVELLSKLLRHGSTAVRELSLLLKFAAAVALLGTPSVRARSGYDVPQIQRAETAPEQSHRTLTLARDDLPAADVLERTSGPSQAAS
jgi:hypothetical protein